MILRGQHRRMLACLLQHGVLHPCTHTHVQVVAKAVPLGILLTAAVGIGYGGYNVVLKEPGN